MKEDKSVFSEKDEFEWGDLGGSTMKKAVSNNSKVSEMGLSRFGSIEEKEPASRVFSNNSNKEKDSKEKDERGLSMFESRIEE